MAEKTVIVFLIPGKNYTLGFMQSWTKLLKEIFNASELIESHFVFFEGSDEWHTRNAIFQYNQDTKTLFDNAWNYDYIISIDPNVIFEPWHVFNLIKKLHFSKDLWVIGATYALEENRTDIFKDFSEEIFLIGNYKYFTLEEIAKWGNEVNNGILPVMNIGIKFFAAKKGLFERLEYPFFAPIQYKISDEVYEVTPGHSLGDRMYKILLRPTVDTFTTVQIDHL
jgi:hypothetical protein